jgi:hypothetical protein
LQEESQNGCSLMLRKLEKMKTLVNS